MSQTLSDKTAEFSSELGASIKSVVKMVAQSRRCTVKPVAKAGERLIIMGNGPSLADNIRNDRDKLSQDKTLAVNFAANADEFTELKPNFYLLADPHFFIGWESDPNVGRLFKRFNDAVDWDMTLFVPVNRPSSSLDITNPHIKVEHFNLVGIEGFQWFTSAAYSAGLGMPRPRNVLVPAIMLGILMGFKDIYIIGADHSWIKTLDVNENNEVVSIQPHFYKDNNEEHSRVASVYKNVRLHEILMSFHVAFKAYHQIAAYASAKGVNIYNSTPASYIDAFPRRPI